MTKTTLSLTLRRYYKKPSYTIGKLYIDGEFFCDTLEDKDRGLNQNMNECDIIRNKVYGETAIPSGSYQVAMCYRSTKFRDHKWAKPYDGKVPRIMQVKGFEGVLIHPGNSSKDTNGCILVGENKERGKVINSVETFHRLMNVLKSAEREITLEII